MPHRKPSWAHNLWNSGAGIALFCTHRTVGKAWTSARSLDSVRPLSNCRACAGRLLCRKNRRLSSSKRCKRPWPRPVGRPSQLAASRGRKPKTARRTPAPSSRSSSLQLKSAQPYRAPSPTGSVCQTLTRPKAGVASLAAQRQAHRSVTGLLKTPPFSRLRTGIPA